MQTIQQLAAASANDRDELRVSIGDAVLEYQVFTAYDELTPRQQRNFLAAIRGRDTAENDATIARIMRAAFKRVVDQSVEMHDSRLSAEVAYFVEH